eukprot:4675363-Pyramimonas_sp.AAC.1
MTSRRADINIANMGCCSFSFRGPASLQILVQLLRDAKERGDPQAAAVMQKLLANQAFLHGAVPLLRPTADLYPNDAPQPR